MKITLRFDDDSGDHKRAFYTAEENDGWNDLRIEVDTDDCNRDHAKAAMAEIIKRCNQDGLQREMLVRCHEHLAAEIARKTLNESAADGTQALLKEVSIVLDGGRR